MDASGHPTFDDLVADALDGIPRELADLLDNVVVLIEDEAPPEQGGILGLYEGIPLTERDGWYAGVLPDRITIYRLPILRMCRTPEDVVREVRITVIHELGHHFGLDDDDLHQLGWG